MTIGAVLDEAWTLYTRFFGRFFLLGLVVFAIVNLAYALLVEAIANDSAGAVATLGILGVAAAIIGTTWLQGAFVYAVQDARDGSFDSTVQDVFVRVSPAILPLLVAGLLAGLAIAIGFVLFIVPGLFLLTIWAVIGPVIVIERTRALDAFGRSRELVRGHGWTVFAFLPRFLEIFVGGTIAQAVVAPFVAIALALTYFRLRDAYGAPAEAVATDP